MNSMRPTRWGTAVIVAAGVAGALAAAAWSAHQAFAAPAPANIKAFMVDTVGPSTAPIWNFGYADRITDEDWADIQRSAAVLVAAVPAITSGGPVASEQERAKSPLWQDWIAKMSTEATAAKTAADAKNQMGLQVAGDNLVEICEGCHMAFDPTAR